MSVAMVAVLISPATSRTESMSSSLMSTVGIGYALGLAEALGDTEALGLTDNEAEALGLTEALGDVLAEGDALWLAVVAVTDCQRPSASTIEIPPAVRIQMEPLP